MTTYIGKSFKFTEEDISIMAKIKEERGISKDIDVIRLGIRSIKGISLPVGNSIESSISDEKPSKAKVSYESPILSPSDWKKLGDGNDPIEGDWVKIKKISKPYTEKVLWYGDEGFQEFLNQ